MGFLLAGPSNETDHIHRALLARGFLVSRVEFAADLASLLLSPIADGEQGVFYPCAWHKQHLRPVRWSSLLAIPAMVAYSIHEAGSEQFAADCAKVLYTSDDCIPFDLDERLLWAKFEAIRRRLQPVPEDDARYLSCVSGEFKFYDTWIRLTPTEKRILQFLWGKRGCLIPFDDIAVWAYNDDNFRQKKTIKVHIHRIRSAFMVAGMTKAAAFAVLETAHARGAALNLDLPVAVIGEQSHEFRAAAE